MILHGKYVFPEDEFVNYVMDKLYGLTGNIVDNFTQSMALALSGQPNIIFLTRLTSNFNVFFLIKIIKIFQTITMCLAGNTDDNFCEYE